MFKRTVPMSDIVDVHVGLICNRMVHTVVFGINSTRNAVRKCEIALGFASHYFTTALLALLYHSRPSYYIY